MSRNLSVAVDNNFTKGLITEATALNFPENACTETFDCVFDKTGRVTRRLGIELEENFEAFENDFEGKAITEYLWNSVGENGVVDMFVLQIGSTISFFGMNSDGSVSPSIKSFEVDITSFATPGATTEQLETNHVQFCHGYGKLWIVHPFIDPVEVSYTSGTDAITTRRLVLKIRDVDGVPNNSAATQEPLQFNIRPTDSEISQVILYNLYNQGWGVRAPVTADGKKWAPDLHPLAMWRGKYASAGVIFHVAGVEGRSDWPAEGDIWFTLKATTVPAIDDNGDAIPPIPPAECFSMMAINKMGQPMAPGPKGHFLLDAFSEDRYTSTILDRDNPAHFDSDFSLLNKFSTGNCAVSFYNRNAGIHRPSATAFFTGRIFYAGVDHEKYTGEIFFSQIVDKFTSNAEKCYQHNDPTTEGLGDLLANDGGIVRIPAMARCVKLMSVGNHLIAFATNGIWRIGGSGGENAGFAANDYSVSKISEVGAVSPLSFTLTDKGIMWWNFDGLWLLSQDASTGVQVQNLALNTIQDYIDDLPSSEFRWVKGSFNPVTRIAQWLHRSATSSSVEDRYVYDRILNLDTQLGAFYPWTIPAGCMKVVGFHCLKGAGEEVVEEEVVDNNGDTVVDSTGEPVTMTIVLNTDLSSRFKYVVRNDCEALEIPDEEEVAASITENGLFIARRFLNVDQQDVSRIPTNSGITKGGDGEYYVLQRGTVSGNGGSLIAIRFDGNPSTVLEYTRAQYTAAINARFGTAYSTFNLGGWAIMPVPFTKYFYAALGTQIPFGAYITFIGLFEIDAGGNIVFIDAMATTSLIETESVAGPNTIFVCGVGFGGPNTSLAVDRPIYAALDGLVWDINGSYGSGVIRLPSVSSFAASVGGTTVTWNSIFVTGLGENRVFFAQQGSDNAQDHSKNEAFFLDGSAGSTLCCMYVSRATAQFHIDNPAHVFTNPTILSFASTNPDGFIIAHRMTGAAASGSWELWNSHFNGGSGFPASDIGLNQDGSVGDVTSFDLNDWQSPSVQPRSTSDGSSYVVWPRRYAHNAINYPPTGSYGGVQLYLWDSTVETGTFVDDVHMNLYDIVSDGVEVNGAYNYPVTSIPFLDPDGFTTLYMVHYLDSDTDSGEFGSENILYKMGDFAEPVVETTPVSLSFAEYNNTNYTDWEQTLGGEDYESYFTTGFKLRGEGIRKWQSNYLCVFSKPDEVHQLSTFDLFSKWDYANTGNVGRWSTTQRIAASGTNYDTWMQKIKVRGHGRAMQFKVTSVDRDPFNLIGWTSWDSANAKP